MGFSYRVLGQRAGVTAQTVSRAEKGEPINDDTSVLISEALGLNVNDLVDIEDRADDITDRMISADAVEALTAEKVLERLQRETGLTLYELPVVGDVLNLMDEIIRDLYVDIDVMDKRVRQVTEDRARLKKYVKWVEKKRREIEKRR